MRERAKSLRWKPCTYCRRCSKLFGCFLQINILLVPDASVNREAAAVFKVKMKSQTSPGWHIKCMSPCKHTLQLSRTINTCRLQICTDKLCYHIGSDSAICFKVYFSSLQFPLCFQWATKLQERQFYRESFYWGLCWKSAGRCYLFIHFDLEVQMFPTQRQLHYTHTRQLWSRWLFPRWKPVISYGKLYSNGS